MSKDQRVVGVWYRLPDQKGQVNVYTLYIGDGSILTFAGPCPQRSLQQTCYLLKEKHRVWETGLLWVNDSKHTPLVEAPGCFVEARFGDGGRELLGVYSQIETLHMWKKIVLNNVFEWMLRFNDANIKCKIMCGKRMLCQCTEMIRFLQDSNKQFFQVFKVL